MFVVLSLLACMSPEDRCEEALDTLNECFASAGSSSAVNASVCSDASAEDAECLEDAAEDAVCTTTEGVQSLVLALCSCDPSACISSGGTTTTTDTGTTGGDTGTTWR